MINIADIKLSQNSVDAIKKIQDYNDFKSLDRVILEQLNNNEDSISNQIYKTNEFNSKGVYEDSVLSA